MAWDSSRLCFAFKNDDFAHIKPPQFSRKREACRSTAHDGNRAGFLNHFCTRLDDSTDPS